MDRSTNRLPQIIYYLASGLYYWAVLLRSILIYLDDPVLISILILMLVGLLLFLSEPAVSHRWSGYLPLYMLFQTSLVFVLLGMPGFSDFFASLLGVLSMQIMQKLNPKVAALWIGACAPVMALLLVGTYGTTQTVALTLIYTAANVFLGTYALTIRREQATQDQKMELARELQAANRQLQDYSAQLEQLSVARERNRFARELHDSVTQTVFSMTLTTQSALTLLERDPIRVRDQLERLSQLVRGALSEMQALISELNPEGAPNLRLIPALRRHLADKRVAEYLSVSLLIEGEQSLNIAEEQALLGIAQESMNNILKHACTDKAQIRLHLEEPYWMEIEDQGLGFDLGQARNSGRMGLINMQERAGEINWNLQIITSPGEGTRIRIEKTSFSESQL